MMGDTMDCGTALLTRATAERVINGDWTQELEVWGEDWEEHALRNTKTKLSCVVVSLTSVHKVVHLLEKQIAQNKSKAKHNEEGCKE